MALLILFIFKWTSESKMLEIFYFNVFYLDGHQFLVADNEQKYPVLNFSDADRVAKI